MSVAIERINAVLGHRYRIEKKLGSGGVATVYLAEDRKYGRKVAVKVLHADVRSAVAAERFLREIEIAARLAHPNIMPVFDSGEEAEFLYFVMPYHGGDSLRDRLTRERQLPIADAVRIALEIADGLGHAHREGIIHRDIKPSNILLSDGHAMIADFGVARAITESTRSSITSSGVAVGTVTYMSPEQVSVDGQLDGRSDVYALGCVLFEMLAGEPPFRATTTHALMTRHIIEPPPSLEQSRPGIGARIDTVTRAALAKLPADRFSSAEEFGRALREAAEASGDAQVLPDPARLAGQGSGRRHVSARRRWLTRLAVLVGLTAVVTGTFVAGPGLIDLLRPALDPDQVVVFAFDDRAGGGGDGADVALGVLQALKFGETLRPIDGWYHMTPAQRANAHLLNVDSARALSERMRAGRFLQGSVLRQGDSVTVTLALYDTRGGVEYDWQSATGSIATSPTHVGLQALRKLLPSLIDPGREIDLSPILDREATAIALWIEGEKDYRLSRFVDALDAYDRALAEDSLFAYAAVKGALAANWLYQPARAREFLDRALATVEAVPGRYRQLALGLEHYANGRADSAVARIRSALDVDPDWSEAWMALGEVNRHLLPLGVQPGSSDREAFEKAALDSGFSPPLLHLTEQAIRDGRLDDAAVWQRRLVALNADPELLIQLDLMHRCVRDGADRMDWRRSAALSPGTVFNVARMLAVGASQSACAKAAFRALLDNPEAEGLNYASTQGLQGLLVAEGRFSEAELLIDSATAAIRGALILYMQDELAGAPMTEKAEQVEAAFVAQFGKEYAGVGSRSRYVLAEWHAMRGETAKVVAIRDSLVTRGAAGDPLARVFSEALSARIALMAGDTVSAIETLSSVRPLSPRADLSYQFPDVLPLEHMIRARVLLLQRRYADAITAAAIFDHGEPIAFLPFVAESLAIRLRAAQALRRSSEVDAYTERLTLLGRADLIGAFD